jgi:predicted RNA-binding protein YlxR (DUF448 family)
LNVHCNKKTSTRSLIRAVVVKKGFEILIEWTKGTLYQ